MLRDRDNNDDDVAGRALRRRPASGVPPYQNSYLFNYLNNLSSVHAGFGEFDRDAEVDLGQHRIELFVAGTVLEIGGDGFQPQ